MIPAAVTILGAVVLWLATGVEPDEIALYLGYEVGFVIAPGYMLFRAISPTAADRLTQLAFGWLLGLVLEVFFFCLTAAVGVRGILPLYPVLVIVSAALVLRARARRAQAAPGVAATTPNERRVAGFTPPQQWALAGVCLAAFAYLGLTLMASSPIPGSVDEVRYQPDPLFGIAIAADAMNHWPPEFAHVSGLALNYHFYGHIHMAAISQTTGIELPIVYLRLVLLPLVALIAIGLSTAGKAIAGNGWAGPLAAGLFLLIGEVDLVTPQLAPFLGINPTLLWWSLTHTFGLAFLIPLALLVAAILDPSLRERSGLPGGGAAWVLLTILLIGAGGAKGVVLTMLAGGLGLYLFWTCVLRRQIDWVAGRLFALCAGILLVYVVVLYGGATGGLHLSFGGTFGQMPALELLRGQFSDAPWAEIPFWGIGSVVGAVCLLGPIALGLYWTVGRGRPSLGAGGAFLLSTLAVGVLSLVFLADEFAANAYFTFNALAVAAPLSAAGICRATEVWARGQQGSRRPVILLSLAWLGLLAVLTYLSWQVFLDGHPARPYVVYPIVAAVLLLLIAWAARAGEDRRPHRVALLIIVVLLTAGADLVLDTVPETQRKLRADEPLYNVADVGLRRGVLNGAVWIRDNLDEDAVLSVSNQRTHSGQTYGPVNLDFPAFAERRTLYEGWALTGGSIDLGAPDVVAGREYPYRDRKNLEFRVFKRGDPEALRTMRAKYGVTHLVIDLRDGRVPKRVYRFGRIVFDNGAIVVIDLAQTPDAKSSQAPGASGTQL